jgi:hypothetical protein
MEYLVWIEESALGVWIRESLWGYPIVLSCHAVGMATVVGVVTMIDIRVLGYARRIPIASFDRLFTIAWAGFLLNFISGCMLFSGDAQRFFFQTVFQIKIGLIVLGGLSIWLLLRQILSNRASDAAKLTAVLSLMFWFGAITAGRLTAYIGLD